MYALLFRMRRKNIAAQNFMLAAFPPAEAFPAAVVNRLGVEATVKETKRAITGGESGDVVGREIGRLAEASEEGEQRSLTHGVGRL